MNATYRNSPSSDLRPSLSDKSNENFHQYLSKGQICRKGFERIRQHRGNRLRDYLRSLRGIRICGFQVNLHTRRLVHKLFHFHIRLYQHTKKKSNRRFRRGTKTKSPDKLLRQDLQWHTGLRCILLYTNKCSYREYFGK